MSYEVKNTEVVTRKPVRLSYAFLNNPRKNNDDNSDGKYGATLLIPKTDKDTIKAIEAAIDAARAEGAANGIKGAKNFPSPLRDGNGSRPRGGEYGPECKGMMVLNSTSKNQPKVCDRNRNPIMDPDEIYSGMWANVLIKFKCFSVPGNSGISCYLNLVQKVRDDQPLGGATPKADDVFEAIDDDDDGLGL